MTPPIPPPDRPLPRISVVIPVKDDALLLERCLEALRRQSLLSSEIVVVDNGSSDLTPAVAGWWQTVYRREETPGIPAAASAGYDASTGEVIARLDADSEPPTDWIERIATAFAGDAALDALTGPGDFRSLPVPARRLVQHGYMDAYFGLFGRLVGHPPLFGSNFAMRRTLWHAARDDVHRTDRQVHDDLDLSFCLGRHARVRLDPELRVRVSSRPFADPRAFLLRVRRGVHTVRVNRRALARRHAPLRIGV